MGKKSRVAGTSAPSRIFLALLLARAFTLPVVAADDLAANPYRPSVGSPASLSAPGYFEWEAGFANVREGSARTRSVPMLLKYAFTDRVGMSLGISPWMSVTAPTGDNSGQSDGTITLKLAQPVNDDLMLGSELTASIPVASNGFGSEHSDVTLNLIASVDVAGFHSDLNVNSTRMGDAPAVGTRFITGGSAGLSHALNDRWGAGLEVSDTRQDGSNSSTQWLGSLSYAASPRWVLDAYAARERLGADHARKFGFGMTYLFAGK